MGKWILAFAALGVAVLLFAGFSRGKNFEIVLSIETPEGLRSGSSVFSFETSDAPFWYPSAVRGSSALSGDAPYVRLPDGRYLFVLLADAYKRRPFREAFYACGQRGLERHEVREKFEVLPCGPRFVLLDEDLDMRSIREVEPGKEGFQIGQGYTIRSLSAARTSTKQEYRLAEELGGLADQFEVQARLRRLARDDPPRGDLQRIGFGAFSSGFAGRGSYKVKLYH